MIRISPLRNTQGVSCEIKGTAVQVQHFHSLWSFLQKMSRDTIVWLILLIAMAHRRKLVVLLLNLCACTIATPTPTELVSDVLSLTQSASQTNVFFQTDVNALSPQLSSCSQCRIPLVLGRLFGASSSSLDRTCERLFRSSKRR